MLQLALFFKRRADKTANARAFPDGVGGRRRGLRGRRLTGDFCLELEEDMGWHRSQTGASLTDSAAVGHDSGSGA